jgi:hypothetical protein
MAIRCDRMLMRLRECNQETDDDDEDDVYSLCRPSTAVHGASEPLDRRLCFALSCCGYGLLSVGSTRSAGSSSLITASQHSSTLLPLLSLAMTSSTANGAVAASATSTSSPSVPIGIDLGHSVSAAAHHAAVSSLLASFPSSSLTVWLCVCVCVCVWVRLLSVAAWLCGATAAWM